MMSVETPAAAEQPTSIPKLSSLPPLPRAAELLFANTTEEKKLYWDRSHYDSPESQMKALTKSSSLYIGNTAFSTRSCHVRSHFEQIGPVRSVNMGLDRFLKQPCGFGFVEYVRRQDALEAVASLTGTKLDGRIIRVELDAGFQPGRQYGRGASGGQVRDERRQRNDPARNAKRAPPTSSAADTTTTTTTDTGMTPRSGPPPDNNNNSNNYYGAAGDKRDRNDDADMGGADRPEKNPRFREE
jgi:nuclear cap-binding protein subunit 2